MAFLNKQTMSSFPLLLVLAACTYNPSASRPIKVQRRQMRTHSPAQKDTLPASAVAARRERRSSKFLPICPIRPRSRDCQKSGGDQVAPRFLSKSDHLLSAGHVSRAPCNLDILISTCPTPAPVQLQRAGRCEMP